MRPTIPGNLNALSAAELRALARDIKAYVISTLSAAEVSAEDRADTAALSATRDECIALAKDKDADAARLAALAADDEDADPEEEEAADDDATEDADGEAADDATEDATDDGKELAVKGKAPVKVKTSVGQDVKPAERRKVGLTHLTAVDGVQGKRSGEQFESWKELGQAAAAKSQSIRGNSSEKFEVAKIVADYPAERVLTDDTNFNMSKFERDELTAALCAPATPYYDLSCMNTTRRPVFNSLPQFQAPRMKVSIQSSPTLSQITTGVGVWTAANDADDNATKSACQTVSCGSTTEYTMYGVYRCITIKNMLAMSYPELVEAWLNRLSAAHARLAEQQLLNAMGTGCTMIDAPLLGYGATTSILSTILNYIALYQETQRWDISGNLEAWLPRYVLTGIKMDLFRRRTTNGAPQRIASDAEVEAMFRDAGVNPHWFIDTPTWAQALPSVGAPLNLLPQAVDILIAPPGKFALMDRGELSIGVTGNGLYRDNTSNTKNQFTFFFENFEGIVNTDSCPAHILHIPVCWNGVQVDDQLVNCLGRDEAGYQS
jgi:hypothetical protein